MDSRLELQVSSPTELSQPPFVFVVDSSGDRCLGGPCGVVSLSGSNVSAHMESCVDMCFHFFRLAAVGLG